ncbi:MAG: LLM class flavin-dependent oxidoreductase [Actinobacteria bacterium]|nr:LLM class flavin-dependent oxidoreductase [Actinomycetota bacterium]
MTVASFQTEDLPRFEAGDWDKPIEVPDHVVLDETMALGNLAEPLGFDSIWVGEHFGTPYSMWPSATQSLAYWAGRTERVDMASCVIVLPWHHPVRLAHGIAMLDNMLGGRRFTLGVGRGVAKSEYDALGIDRAEARGRFKEVWEILKLALTQERISYDGDYYKIPETTIRPRPRHDDLLDHAACAFTTPESMEMAAREGFKQLFVTGAPLAEMSVGVDLYNTIRASKGLEPDQPSVLMWAYCTEDDREAERGNEYFVRNGLEVATHYGFTRPGEFDGVKGYEAYADIANASGGPDGTSGQGAAMVQNDTQPIGTPETIIERLRVLQKNTGAKEITIVPQFGGMSLKEAEKSVRLFAKEVLPVVQAEEAPVRLPESVVG